MEIIVLIVPVSMVWAIWNLCKEPLDFCRPVVDIQQNYDQLSCKTGRAGLKIKDLLFLDKLFSGSGKRSFSRHIPGRGAPSTATIIKRNDIIIG